jgi:integrase/recombinase XerC
MHDVGLRRGELVAMDLVDVGLVDGEFGRVSIVRKGKREKIDRTLNDRIREALQAWIDVRGDWPGPLFVRLDHAAGEEPGRLTGDAVNSMVRTLSTRAGLARETRAHGLRHQGITRALDETGGNIRAAQQFSGHSKPETVMRYDDNRADVAGEITRKIGRGD